MSSTTTKTTTSTKDEAEIRAVISAWSKAVETRDLDALEAAYAPEAVLFDAMPPYKTQGAANIRKVWEMCFPYFPEKFTSEHRDMVINVDGDLAFVHCVHHFIPTPADHPCGATWMRVTACYRRIDGVWKAVHEHVSIPFNPMTNEAFFIADPDVIETPDYSSAQPPCEN